MKTAFATLAVLVATATAEAKTESEVNALKYVARGIVQTALVPSMKNPSAAIVCPLKEISWVAPAEQWYMNGEPVEADVFTGWIDGTNSFGARVRENWQIHLLDSKLVLIKLGRSQEKADGYGTANIKDLAKQRLAFQERQLALQRLETVQSLGKAAARKRASKATRRIPAGIAGNLAKSAAAKADIKEDERPIFVDAYLAALGY